MNRFVQLSLVALALNWPAWGQIQQSRTGGPGKAGLFHAFPMYFACPHTGVTSLVLWLPVPQEIRTDCINTTSSCIYVNYKYNI